VEGRRNGRSTPEIRGVPRACPYVLGLTIGGIAARARQIHAKIIEPDFLACDGARNAADLLNDRVVPFFDEKK
jgi:hypothetical protein